MSQFVIPDNVFKALEGKSEDYHRNYIQEQTSILGPNHPAIEAISEHTNNRFGAYNVPVERPEINQFGFYQLNDDQRFEAADSLATGSFIQDIESQLEQRIQRTVPNTQRMMYPTFGYTPQADMQNPQFTEARLGAIREGFTDRLARALNENPQNIDIDGGLDRPVQRALLSFQQEPQEKLSFLQKEFGRENVKQFEYNGKPNFLIKQDGRQVLVDELGFAFGDILDMTRGAVTMTGEIAGGFAGPYTKLPLIRKGATVVKGAMGAGAGKTATEYLSEGIESGVNPEADFQSVAPIGRGAMTTAIDYPMGKSFQFLGRALFNKRVPGVSEQMDDVIQAADRLMRRFSDEGIDIPLSPSMRMSRGAAQLEQETIEQTARAGVSAPEQSGVARLRLELADNMQRLLDILQTGQGNMDEIIEASVKNFDDMSSAAAASGKEEVIGAASVLEKHFKNLSDNVLETANRRDNVQIGEELGNTVRNIFESSKSRVDDAYDAAKIAGQRIPNTDMLDVAQQLINSIDGLGIPTGASNRLIRSFVPRKVLSQLRKAEDIGANAKARLKQIAEYEDAIQGIEGDQMTMFSLFDETAPVNPGDPLTLSFQQIIDFKKNIGKLYGATARDQFLDRKGLGAMIDSLDGILDNMATESDSMAYDLLQEANQMWLRERKPILDDGELAKIAGAKIDEIRTAGVLLDQGANSANRLKNIRNALPDEASKLQFDKEIREAAVERLFYLAEDSNSLINVAKLSKALSENQIFNKKSGFFDDKMIESLKRMGRFSQQRKDILGLSAAPTIPLESVKQVLLDTDLPVQERRILLGKITDQMRLSNRMDSIRANQARQNIAQGGGDFADNANSTMEAILGLPNSGAVKEVFDTLDEPMKNQIRAKIRAHIFAGASTGGGGTRTSTNLGEVQLPDPNSQIMQDLLNTESKQYEVVKEILGPEGVQDIVDVVKILDRMGGNYIDEGSSLLSGNQVQAIGRGGNRRTFVPRVIIGFDMGVPIYKMLGFALSNEKFVRAINSGQADSAINNLLPFVFGSDIALEAYLEESTGDPRLFKAIPKLIGSPDRGVNDSLVN